MMLRAINVAAHGYRWSERADPEFARSTRAMTAREATWQMLRSVGAEIILRAGFGCVLVSLPFVWFAGNEKGVGPALLLTVGYSIGMFPFCSLFALLVAALAVGRSRTALVLTAAQARESSVLRRVNVISVIAAVCLGALVASSAL